MYIFRVMSYQSYGKFACGHVRLLSCNNHNHRVRILITLSNIAKCIICTVFPSRTMAKSRHMLSFPAPTEENNAHVQGMCELCEASKPQTQLSTPETWKHTTQFNSPELCVPIMSERYN